MKEYLHKISESAKFRKWFPYILLVILLSLTVYSWQVLSNVKTEKERERYEGYTKQIVSKITKQFYKYMMVIQGGVVLFTASEEVTRDEWKIYCETRQVRTFFPGIQNIGVSRVVLPAELAQHIQEIRAEGYPEYTLWPEGKRDVYTAIVFLEPFDARNQKAFGYDMFSEPVRRAAMERARDTGEVSISDKVMLVQETDKNIEPGFLMYAPIYLNGMPLKSIENRRAALLGYVYSPFRMGDFLGKGLSDSPQGIDFTIYDGTQISLANLMYEYHEHPMAPDENRKPIFSSQQTVDLYGQQWTLVFETCPSFDVAFNRLTPFIILAGGLCINLLIFFFTWKQEKSRKELEIMKNTADKLRKEAELANMAKSAFLANMSHEIRTPMNSVLGFIQIVLEGNELSDKYRGHLEMAYGSAHNLLTIINDILDVSKLESDNFELEMTDFNLPQTIKKVLKTLEPLAKEKGIVLFFDFDVKLPHCYSGDPGRMSQILLNLVGNAIKFTEKGNVTIGVRASDQEGDLLHFTVADTGIGMAPEQAATIFKPFTQADASTSRLYGGTGLGLTIVKQIVEAMNGRIWVESELGNGSIFHFTAQLTGNPDTVYCIDYELAMEKLPLKSARRFQILLAEDILENATLAKLRLEQQGHLVRHVWNGREAVELYNTAAFDLILMDMMMPEMDGLEATRKIRKLEEKSNKHITIIALTASIMNEDRKRCMKAGMDAVVGKPINLEELFSIMEEVVPDGIGTLNDDIFVDFQEKPEIDFTGLAHIVDIEKGLAVWQNPLIFAKSLISFIHKHSNDVNKIQQLLSQGNGKEAEIIAHTLKGVAGNLFLSKVTRFATEIDALLKTGTDEQTENLIPRLQEALKNATEAIEHLKIPVLKETGEPTKNFNSKAVSRLLHELLNVLDEDNPSVTEPVLDRLIEYVPLKDMVRISKAIDSFDFDQAKAQTKILAEKLGIKMEI